MSYFTKPTLKVVEPVQEAAAPVRAPEPTAVDQPKTEPAPSGANPAAHLASFQFQPGQSGNPQGRPKGSRNKLTEAFIADLFDDWRSHGKEAIAATREEKPAEYLKVVAGLAPKKIEVKEDPLDAFDDDELSAALAAIAAVRQAQDAGGEDRGQAPGPGGQKPH